MYDSGRAADEIVAAEGLAQIGDEAALLAIVREVHRPATPTRWRSTAPARQQTFGFLVGQVMKGSGGKANPKLANQLLKRELDSRADWRRRRRAILTVTPATQTPLAPGAQAA